MSKSVAVAEALLRRKELGMKVEQLKKLTEADVYEAHVQRKHVAEGIDEIFAKVPKLTASQVTAEFDYYAKQLRKIDAAIQRSNWETNVTVDDEVMAAYRPPKEEEDDK